MLDWNDGLGLAPLVIVAADHDVEAPVTALFFRFYEAESLHVEEVVFHPADLIFAHTAALQIHGYARQMGGGSIAFPRSGVAIMATQLLLNLDGADGGVDLDLLVESVVIGLADVVDEVQRPRTAEATGRI